MRQITSVLSQKDFPKYDMTKKKLYFLTKTKYDSKFENIKILFKRENINVGTFDIETDYDNGFPHPSEASQKVLSITYKSSKSKLYHVWGYGDFSVLNS